TALLDDIKKHGLQAPISLYQGKILDGRNRYRACRELGIECQTREYRGDDPAGFVLSMNLHRRHLTQEQKRELVTKLLKATPKKSNREIGKLARANHKTVDRIRRKEESTGDIPQLARTIGKDGKARRVRRPNRGLARPTLARAAKHELDVIEGGTAKPEEDED